MLHELTIERIALIDSVRLRLETGFNVFTGETGAGKSIVLDAIGLLLGNRGSSDLIRKGSDSALVEAVFEVSGTAGERASALLQDWGFESDASLLISRELFRNGRTVCRVNGRLANVQMLRDLGALLIQQHGQHDHQGLMHADEQLRALDLYGKHAELLSAVRTAHANYMECKKQYENSQLDEQARIQRLDVLDFQIREIEDAELVIGEEEELRERKQKLQHVEKITNALQSAKNALDGSERFSGALALLAEARDEVAAAAVYDGELREAAELLQTAQVHADEAARVVYKQLDGCDEDPLVLEHIETRLALLRNLERKYGVSIEEVLAYAKAARAERDGLKNHEQHTQDLQKRMESVFGHLTRAAHRLHEARVEAARELSARVRDVLKELSMPHAELKVEVSERRGANGEVQYGAGGSDAVTFLFSANRGEDPRPLQKVASGGELSRTLLALKAVLADVDDLETLIFDEIDTGISGAAAQSVADQMVRISTTRQVLCVTHSAAVAASGAVHFYIEKDEDNHQTTTVVERLDESGRVQEIARLLGAGIADDTAVSHAKALLGKMSQRVI